MKGVSISPWLTTPWLERFEKDEFKDRISASPSSGKHFFHVLKFIYSEKATKFCEIFTLMLCVCTVDKCKVKISQTFAAFIILFTYIDFKIYCHNCTVYVRPRSKTGSRMIFLFLVWMMIVSRMCARCW